MTGIWWCPWSSKPVWGSEGSWVGSIPIRLRHFLPEVDMSNSRRLLDALLLAFRPARWSVFGFRFVPLLLFAAGVWAVVYGGFYHRIPVTETHEEQITIAVPAERPMPPGGPPEMPLSTSDACGQPTDGSTPPPEAFGPPVKFIQAMKTDEDHVRGVGTRGESGRDGRRHHS